MEETRSSDELVVAISSTVVVFLVISILMLIAGFACGYYLRGRKLSKKTSNNPGPISIASQQAAAPYYEDVDVLPSAVKHQEQSLELKENVAYGPSKSMSVEQK